MVAMKILKAYKTELDPNNVQRTLLAKHAGAARFTWNWALNRRIEEYKLTGKSSNAIEQHRQLNSLKPTDFPWMYEVSKCAPQEALRDLDKAFRNFFAKRAKHPRFKSKKRGLGGFRLTGSITIEADRIKLPRIGWLRLKEPGYLPTDAKINSVTIKERAGRWFVSVQVEEQIAVSENQGPAIGLDLGLKSFVVGSDGSSLEAPKPLLHSLRRLQRLSRQHSRKQKGSMNRRKSAKRLAKLHYRIGCQRADFLHKLSSHLTNPNSRALMSLCQMQTQKNGVRLCGSFGRDGLMLDSASVKENGQSFQAKRDALFAPRTIDDTPSNKPTNAVKLASASSGVEGQHYQEVDAANSAKEKGVSDGEGSNSQPLTPTVVPDVFAAERLSQTSSASTISTVVASSTEKKSATVCTIGSEGTSGLQGSKSSAGIATTASISATASVRTSGNDATSELAKTKSVIVVEDLNVGGMLKNRCLARAISDAGWSEFVRQLEYKAAWNGGSVVKAGRFYPSTKTCSACGMVKDLMPLSERTYCCDGCGLVIDRDVNAARNLLSLSSASSARLQACGDSPLGGSAKQEPSVMNNE